MNKLLLLLPFLSLGNSLYAASGIIDWGATGNSVFPNGSEGQSEFVLDSNGNTSITFDTFSDGSTNALDTVFNPNDRQQGRLAGTDINGGGLFSEPQVNFTIEGNSGPGAGTSGSMRVILDRSTSDPWGSGHVFGFPDRPIGSNGPAGQDAGESGLRFFTQGGPWARDDGSVTVRLNFSAYAEGAIDNLEFGLFGINRQTGSEIDAGEGADIVSVSATDENGLAIDISSFFTTSITPNFEQSGTTSVVFDATNSELHDLRGNPSPNSSRFSDHQDSDGNAVFNSGSQKIQTLTITYEGVSTGSRPTESSSGFLLSDLSFETVPEPSVFMFSFVGLAGLMLHRKRD